MPLTTALRLAYQVVAVGLLKLHVLEAILANPELGLFPIIFWEWREIPRVNLIVPDMDFVHIFHFGDLKRERKTNRGPWTDDAPFPYDLQATS